MKKTFTWVSSYRSTYNRKSGRGSSSIGAGQRSGVSYSRPTNHNDASSSITRGFISRSISSHVRFSFLSSMSSMAEKQPLLTPLIQRQRYVLVIHGGAGTMTKEGSTPEQQAAYKDSLRTALEAVCDAQPNVPASCSLWLRDIRSSVTEAKQWMLLWQPWRSWKVGKLLVSRRPIQFISACIADNPLFNCAKGAVFNVDGKVCRFMQNHFCQSKRDTAE
jgi:hypothetical protein